MYVLFFARGYENKENYIISNMVANRQVQPGSQVGLQRRHEIETIHSLVNGREWCEAHSLLRVCEAHSLVRGCE